MYLELTEVRQLLLCVSRQLRVVGPVQEAVCAFSEGRSARNFFLVFLSILDLYLYFMGHLHVSGVDRSSAAVAVCFLAATSCWRRARGCVCVIGRTKCSQFFSCVLEHLGLVLHGSSAICMYLELTEVGQLLLCVSRQLLAVGVVQEAVCALSEG